MEGLPTLSSYVYGFGQHVVLVGVVVVVLLILFGGLGRPMGIPLLFWNEVKWKQALAGVASAGLIGSAFGIGDALAQKHEPDHANAPRRVAFVVGGYVLCAVLVGVARGLPMLLHGIWNLSRRIGERDGAPAPKKRHVARPSNEWPLPIGLGIGSAVTIGLVWFRAAVLWPLPPWITVIGGLVAVAIVVRVLVHIVTPAAELCLALGFVEVIYFAISYLTNVGTPALLMLATVGLLILIGGIPEYRLRFAFLDRERAKLYRHPVRLQDYSDGACTYSLLPATTAVATGDTPRPLVIVCASGGGLRAAVWTVAVLTELERARPGFSSLVRIVTGASGGIMGAAGWVASLHKEQMADEKLVALVGKESLSAVAQTLVLRDMPLALLPIVNRHDRGRRLEERWEENIPALGGLRMVDLRSDEASGRVPSLIVSPMLVEDGRRVIISNLDLSALTLNTTPVAPGSPPQSSRSAYEMARLFPEAFGEMHLSTAARMSASFPYASPACALPTLPRRRLVDAGYYDNYGVDLACRWIERCLLPNLGADFGKHVSEILIVQIRDGVSSLATTGVSQATTPPIARGVDGVLGPLDAVLAAREAVPLQRNDADLERLGKLLNAGRPGFFRVATFAFEGEASLSWYLTAQEQARIQDAARSAVQAQAPLLP